MVDYSKWKTIEVSDDEDDTHPNIDTPSLFRWRHQARVERMQEFETEKKKLDTNIELHGKKKLEIDDKKKNGQDVTDLEEEWKKKDEELKKLKEEMTKKEKVTPWNVDTIGQDGFSKTIINTKAKPVQKNMTEEERAIQLKEFSTKYERSLKQFGLLRKHEDSKRFLLDNPHLACEDTANFLVLWCVELAVSGKNELMEHVSHQAIAIQFLLELSKQLDVDPRSCISSFFTKIAMEGASEYRETFDVELKLFRERINRRAEQKILEIEEEERQARLGPGGLDPLEVLETLPAELRVCFETQDIPLLKETIKKMPEKEAAEHMRRCIDSGLWIPDANAHKQESEPTEEEAKPEAVPEAETTPQDSAEKKND